MEQQFNDQQLQQEVESTPATGFRVIWREFRKDKLAMVSLIIVALIILGSIIWSFFIDQEKLMEVSLLDEFARPGENGFLLGADQGGSDILGQLIVGAKNSIIIAIAITVITGVLGIAIGIICGYYGGIVDNFFMRLIDFIITLPSTMIIIVFVTIIPKYNVWSFILIMSAFMWVGTARLVRSKALSESRRDYVSASKTMGTSNFAIMFKGIMPNLSSLLIVELTLNFAGNVGIETGLTFLGFGLPDSTPSLGTLVSFASNQTVIAEKWWVWLPASLLILILMLGINYVGQALRRSADAKQRLG